MDDPSRGGRGSTWTRGAGGLGLVLALVTVPCSAGALDQVRSVIPSDRAEPLQVRVWLDRGDAPVLERGERARLYYRTSGDAYVALFHVSTDGIVRLLHPRVPDQDHYVRRDRDYRLLFPRSPYWFVDDDPGVGYFFAVASPRPFDFSSIRYSTQAGGWDLSPVGRRVYSDPYAAMDEYVAALIPGWRNATYALDFVEYHVGERHRYPRFLCYDCHGFQPYQSWNPYHYACTSFRLVVDTDPYFYPARRYRGTRVVYARPPATAAPRFSFKERADGEPSSPVYRRRDAEELPGIDEVARPRAPGDDALGDDGPVGRESDRRAPSAVDAVRRPSERARSDVESRRDAASTDAPRPVLLRRPAGDDAPPARPDRTSRPTGSPSPRARPDVRRPAPSSTARPSGRPAPSSPSEPSVRRRSPPDA